MTREDSILYAYRHDIPITATKEKLYSIDDNLWGRAIECGEMEDPWAVPPPGVWLLTKPTATEPRDLVVGFEQGVPVVGRRRALADARRSSTGSTRSSAPTAGAASTWSRTAASASRAARPTSARPAWR